MIALDTHVVVWLHAGELALLPARVRQRIDAEESVVCPIVSLELEFLYEIDRIALTADTILADLTAEIGLLTCSRPFATTIRESLKMKWTRDPFDRLISAHSIAHDLDLATRDRAMRAHCPKAFWD